MSSSTRRIILFLGITALSSSPIWVKISTAPSAVLALYRMCFTVLVLLPFVLLRSRSELKSLSRSGILMAALAGLAFGCHLLTCFEAAHRTSVASTTTLGATEVFFVAIFALVIWKEKISKKAWFGIGIAFLGCFITTVIDFSVTASHLVGDAFSLLSMLFSATFVLLGRTARKHDISTSVFSFIAYISTTVVLLLFNLASGVDFIHIDPVNYICAFGMTFCCTLAGHTIVTWVLKYERAATVSTVKLIAPVTSSIMGVIFLNEIPGLFSVIGALIIIGGIYMFLHFNQEESPAALNSAK